MKTLLLAAALLLPAAAQAGSVIIPAITETFSMAATAAIPDGDLNGLVQTITPTPTIGVLESITVTLNTVGGWNGDLYIYLWHAGEISVLVNRPGRTAGNSAGSATGSMFLTLADSAATDFHNAPGGFGSSLSGTFQPSGRNLHPLNALDTTPRTAALSTFTGDPAAGEYRLFIADVAPGETATLTSWSITLTGQAIPEPSAPLLILLPAAALLRSRRRPAVGV